MSTLVRRHPPPLHCPFPPRRCQCAAGFIQSQSPTGFDFSEIPIHCSQSGDKLRVKGLSQIILNPVTPEKKVSSTIKPLGGETTTQEHKGHQDLKALCCLCFFMHHVCNPLAILFVPMLLNSIILHIIQKIFFFNKERNTTSVSFKST